MTHRRHRGRGFSVRPDSFQGPSFLHGPWAGVGGQGHWAARQLAGKPRDGLSVAEVLKRDFINNTREPSGTMPGAAIPHDVCGDVANAAPRKRQIGTPATGAATRVVLL